ncbi:MAG: hypothetical protein J1F33_08290 [Clostridiales bacterium]|nr:hypothetical protein [Clostridiales bacterium]
MKKQNILLVLKILENNTDSLHPMTQTEIAELISAKYPCDRKTVGRNIAFLKDIGYPIVKTSRGFYLDNKRFTVDERNIIISAIREYSAATEEMKSDVLERLTNILDKPVVW